MTTKQIIDTLYKLEFFSVVKNGIDPSIEIVGSGQVSRVYLDQGKIYIIGEEKVEDLIRLAQALRNTGLELEDLKDSNKVFISGARYAIEQYNKEIEKSFTAHIEDLILGDDKSDKLLKEGKEAAKRWNKRQEEGKQ